jgi:hypothetical protein
MHRPPGPVHVAPSGPVHVAPTAPSSGWSGRSTPPHSASQGHGATQGHGGSNSGGPIH